MTMIKIIILPILFLCLSVAAKETGIELLPVSAPGKVGMSSEILAKIGPEVETLIEKKKLVGGSVLILRDGKSFTKISLDMPTGPPKFR